MPRFRFSLALLIALLAGALLPAWGQQLSSAQIPKVESHRVCAHPSASNTMACNARVVTSSLAGYRKASGVVGAPAAPAGYGPADLQSAYSLASLSSTAGTGRTIAIVDAYDDPNAEADLAVYRSTFGLPPCTSASGCFQKVNQLGATTPLPSPDGEWSEEISLDLDIASAICPNCNLLLVEASTATDSDLGPAVNTAAGWPGIAAISNSYGGTESSIDLLVNCPTYYNHTGVAITASSGDGGYPIIGYGVITPAGCSQVTAVGGTSLLSASNSRGWSETVWFTDDSEATASGCSFYLSKPSWQIDSGCTKRTVADVSAVADPATGAAAYDTYPNSDGVNGWIVFGGNSVSTALIAGVYALAAPPASTDYPASYAYANPSAFNDVTSGFSSSSCATYLCMAEVGYDGPTGWGTPNGIGGFEAGDSFNFSISASPSNVSMYQGTSLTSTISTTIIAGTGTITLSLSGLPPGATASLSPPSIASGSSSTLTINAGTAAPGVYVLTATGTGTTMTRSTSITVAINAALVNDFSISASPSTLNLVQNTSGMRTISTAITLGSPESVNLTISGLPAGATATINPLLINSGSSATLTVNAGTAAVGTYSLLITGTAVGVYNTHSTTVTLVVSVPTADFTITASPSNLTVGHPSIGIFTVKVAASNGFTGKVNFTVSGFPSKIAGGFLPASITGSGTSYLVFVVGLKQSAGTFPLTITGTSGSIQHTGNVTLVVH